YSFVQLFSAIVGGAIFLSVQPGKRSPQSNFEYALLSDLAVGLTALVTIVLILETMRSRRGDRERISELGGKNFYVEYHIPLPRRSAKAVELTMVFSIFVACAGFIILNPFSSPYLTDDHQTVPNARP